MGHSFKDCVPVRYLLDALSLLKAQEPHVMTPEEVERVEENGVIWEEVRIKDTCLPMIRFGNTFEGEDYLSVYEVTECDDYLREYRCWNLQPTNAQRNATPWEPIK